MTGCARLGWMYRYGRGGLERDEGADAGRALGRVRGAAFGALATPTVGRSRIPYEWLSL